MSSQFEDQMSDRYKCEFCKHCLSTKRGLKTHQDTAKYCLGSRGVSVKSDVKCSYCEKSFTLKGHLTVHLKSCRDKEIVDLEADHEIALRNLKKKIRNLKAIHTAQVGELTQTNAALKKRLTSANNKIARQKAEIIRLGKDVSHGEGQIEMCEKMGTTTQIIANNAYVNPRLADIPIGNIRPFTRKTIQEDISDGKYTYNLFTQGLPGLVTFITNIVQIDGDSDDPRSVERNYACTDGSRYKFHRLLESKKWVKDNGAAFLGTILDELKIPAKKHIDQLIGYVKSATGDPDMRDGYDRVLNRAKPIFFGIDSPHGADPRKKLFESLRTEIKMIAAV